MQWDTSEHDWLEGRGPRLYLLAMIDDATSQALARFATQDTTQENFRSPFYRFRTLRFRRSCSR